MSIVLDEINAAFKAAQVAGTAHTSEPKHYRELQRVNPIIEHPITVNTRPGCEVVNAISRDGQRRYHLEARNRRMNDGTTRTYSRLRVGSAQER